MTYNIVLTTAEDIVAVVDAVLAKPQDCTESFIAEFTELTDDQVRNALHMGIELGLVSKNSSNDTYNSKSSLARLLICANNDSHKAAIMRIILEQYPPFIDFKSRFSFTDAVDLASRQIKVLYGMTTSQRDIKNTIISLSTYAKTFISEGANLYRSNESDTSYIDLLEETLGIKASNETLLLEHLGDETYQYIDRDNVFNPLSESYSKIQNIPNDIRATIIYAGNAFESFLQQIADDNSISLSGKSGIISKSEALSSILSKKHRGMINYIGQIRNAADHGADVDEDGKMWLISEETSYLYPLVVATIIKDIVLYNNGIIQV
jgi:hypothetical protein